MVYSITAASSFEKVKEVREKILFSKNSNSVPMIIVGNKKDLEKERKVNTDTVEALAQQWGCKFLEASAKTGEVIFIYCFIFFFFLFFLIPLFFFV